MNKNERLSIEPGVKNLFGRRIFFFRPDDPDHETTAPVPPKLDRSLEYVACVKAPSACTSCHSRPFFSMQKKKVGKDDFFSLDKSTHQCKIFLFHFVIFQFSGRERDGESNCVSLVVSYEL